MAWWWRLPDCVDFFNRGVFHHPVWFVFLLGCVPTPHHALSTRPPRGIWITVGLGDLCFSAPPPPARLLGASPPPERLLGASLGIPSPQIGALHQDSSMASLTTRLCLPWFGKGVFFTLSVVRSLPFRRACLARIWCPLFFEVSWLLALLWCAFSTSDRLNGCVGRMSYQTPTFFSSTVSRRWSCRCSASAEKKRW